MAKHPKIMLLLGLFLGLFSTLFLYWSSATIPLIMQTWGGNSPGELLFRTARQTENRIGIALLFGAFLFQAFAVFKGDVLQPDNSLSESKQVRLRHLQCWITIVALLVAGIHIGWPAISIDGITVTLLFIALVPWLAPLFKSLEFPGGWKIEFSEFERAEKRMEDAGLLPQKADEKPKYSFQYVLDDDPQLALAGLRIEIEKRLRKMSGDSQQFVRNRSLRELLRNLTLRSVLSQEEGAILLDLTALLNKAVHAHDVDRRSVEWAMELGPRLLEGLDRKLGE